MKIVISVILIVNFLFTPVFAFASDVETSSDEYEDSLWHKGLMSLQDALDNIPQAMNDLRSVAETFGQSVDATISTLVNAPVRAVASSFMATASDMVDTATDALVSGRDFMSSIFIDSYNKCFVWNEETVKKGHEIVLPLFQTNSGTWVDNWYQLEVPKETRWTFNNKYGGDRRCYYWYPSTIDSSTKFYITYVNYDGTYTPVLGYKGVSDNRAFANWYVGDSYYNETYFNHYLNNVIHITGYIGSTYLFPRDYTYINDTLITPYTSFNAAASALNDNRPEGHPVPNGKGFFRPVPQGVNKVTGSNVYNNNWGDIIVNNYTTYGDTFENTTINNYYYNGTNKDTPVYWYDIYDNNTVSIPQHDYDDLSDVTLANPNIVANHNFITDVFGAIPVVITTLFISCLLLAIVIIFLKG